jgi:hypothetical protein
MLACFGRVVLRFDRLPKPWLDANFSTQNRYSMTFGASVTNFFASVGLKNESIVKLFFDMVADVFDFELFRPSALVMICSTPNLYRCRRTSSTSTGSNQVFFWGVPNLAESNYTPCSKNNYGVG